MFKLEPRKHCGSCVILQNRDANGIKNACTAASEYSPVSIQTPGKSQLPSRMSHEREGNHRQWCGPLQGKPRCGGIPLRKSTPPPLPAKKKRLFISGSGIAPVPARPIGEQGSSSAGALEQSASVLQAKPRRHWSWWDKGGVPFSRSNNSTISGRWCRDGNSGPFQRTGSFGPAHKKEPALLA